MGHGFKPWSGKIPHALGQLSPGATGEATAVRSPSNAATERPLAETKAQHSQKQLTDFIIFQNASCVFWSSFREGSCGSLLLRVSSLQLPQPQARPWRCRQAWTAEAGRRQGRLGPPFGSTCQTSVGCAD